MRRILLAGLLALAAFSNFISRPASALEERVCQERQQTMNKTENGKPHRQQHREQMLNKQAETAKVQQEVMNKHICS